jgi:PAS domain S-box-containing protein
MHEGQQGTGRAAGRGDPATAPHALIVESMTEGVSLAREDGIIVYTNPAEDLMFGYGPGELLGQHVSVQNAYPPRENEARVADVIETLRLRGVWEGEWHNRRKDGTGFYTAARITAVAVEGRTHWLCVQRDVTAQRAAEAAHRESEERLELAIEGTGVGIFDLDLSTGDGFWSDSAFRMLGYTPAPDGRASFAMWRDRLHPDDADYALGEHQAAEASGGALKVEFRILRADDGEVRWLSAFGRMIPGPNGARSIGTVMDTTERRRAEEHLKLLVNELNHRVKNTLAIIQGIAHQTFKGEEVPLERREAFEGRLSALSEAHNLLTRESWEAASIMEVIRAALGPYSGQERVRIDGPDFRVSPRLAVSLALAMHELGTNAAKYGALSGGGGPRVVEPTQRGFGTRMIERALAAELNGEARIDFAPEGLVCRVNAQMPG